MVNMKGNAQPPQNQKVRRRLDWSEKHFRRMETLSKRTFVIGVKKGNYAVRHTDSTCVRIIRPVATQNQSQKQRYIQLH